MVNKKPIKEAYILESVRLLLHVHGRGGLALVEASRLILKTWVAFGISILCASFVPSLSFVQKKVSSTCKLMQCECSSFLSTSY